MLKRLRESSISQESTTPASRQSTVTSPRDKAAPSSLPSQQQQQTQQQPTQTAKPMLGQVGRGPSLLGLLAAKRFTRNLRNKYGRTNSLFGSSRHSTSIQIQREPTYRMEPQKKFSADEVEDIIRQVIDDRMKGFKYHPKFCSNMCKLLSDELKDNVKKLKYDRYKIVAVVHIGEKKDQSTFVASRCAWDKHLDDYATYTMDTATLFCTASVFGLYTE